MEGTRVKANRKTIQLREICPDKRRACQGVKEEG